MKLLLIRPVGSTFSILSEKATIEILQFDAEKFKGRLQEFVSSLVGRSFDGIIIPDSLDDSLNYLGLELCTRIRLSSNELGNKSYSTFFIYNPKDPQEIYKSQLLQKANTTASLFFTKGAFSFNDNDFVKILIENNSNFNILNKDNFKESFLEVIQIKKNPTFGNHTIANIWGAIRLAEVTGNRELLDSYFNSNNSIKINLSDLYFKYLLNQNSFSDTSPVSIKTINSNGKNILLIDDEVDKGWGIILKNILKGANFESISPGTNFINEAKAKIKEKSNGVSKWDLILLDLRLEKDEDQGINTYNPTSEYTGAKLLKELKSDNFGIQIIMFTASNKAWHMKRLELLGSDGFYVKESPEFSISQKHSEESFIDLKNQIERCLNKSFLKNVFEKYKPLEELCEKEYNKNNKSYSLSIQPGTLENIINQLFVFKKLLTDYPLELRWAFITLILIVEEILNESYIDDGIDQVVEVNIFKKIKCNYIDRSLRKLAISPQNYGNSYNSGEYIVPNEELPFYNKRASRTPFNFRLTCLLHFKYNLPIDSTIFKYFKIYQLRSDSVAHAGNKQVTEADICLALDLLKDLIK